jgi:trimethylamine--corrinoid protein Co-methyltransferase
MASESFEPSVRVQILDESSIKQIHKAALTVLEKTGVTIATQDARRILIDAGCKLRGENIVTIPADLVENALKTAPSAVTLYDRFGEARCVLEGTKTSFGTGSDCPFIRDIQTGERRACTYDDVSKGALICDTLEHFDFVMPIGIISDKPSEVADVYEVEATIKNTIKPVVFTAQNNTSFQAVIDLAATVAGGLEQLQQKPTICLYDEPTSPLKQMPEATDKLILAAQNRIPVIFTPAPIGGGTAPATGAGVLVMGTAECLAGLVLHQLTTPGAPIIFGGVMFMMDMATTVATYGSAERNQLCAALADIAHYYNLPVFGTAGCSDSKVVDVQAGMEMGLSVLLSTLNGQNLIHDVGYLESGLVTSYEMYIMGNETIKMAKHIARGLIVNEQTLAVDVIDQVANQSGDFLTHEHTLKFFRQ